MLSEVRSPNDTLVAHSAMCPVRYHSNCLPPAAAGYYFLSEARALPRMDTVVDTATNIPNWVSFILRRFYVNMVASCNSNPDIFIFQRPFLRSRYDVVQEEYGEEDIYDRDLRNKFRLTRNRNRFRR